MNNRAKHNSRAVLETEMNFYERRLNRELLAELDSDFRASLGSEDLSAGESQEEVLAQQFFVYLKGRVDFELTYLSDLRKRDADFNVAFSRARGEEERRHQIIEYAKDLGATGRELRKDWRAFARYFGEDAVSDRFQRRHSASERRLAFVLERLGPVGARVISAWSASIGHEEAWSRLSLEEALKPVLQFDGDPRVVCAAFRGLSRVLRELPVQLQERCVDENTLQFIYRAAIHPGEDVWTQCASIELLETLSPRSLTRVLQQRLTKVSGGDDLFVRKRAVEVLARNCAWSDLLRRLVEIAGRDPSPYVRQALCRALVDAPTDVAHRHLRRTVVSDSVPQVRASAILAYVDLLERRDPRLVSGLREIIEACVARETDAFVQRVVVHASSEATRRLLELGLDGVDEVIESLKDSLSRLHLEAKSLAVRRHAAMGRERVWCMSDEKARSFLERIESFHRSLESGRPRNLPRDITADVDTETAGRVLSVLSQEEFGCDVRRGLLRDSIVKGDQFRFRLWRMLHEFRNASPDKRQAFPHTTARIREGDLCAPSAILAELAQTKVPGEPLFMSQEGGWRPYLPLVDEVLSSLDQSMSVRPVLFYTSEGVTELHPPSDPIQRGRAYVRLTRRFEEFARLRNWKSQEDGSPKAYVEALVKLGFEVKLRPFECDKSAGELDPSVVRFFPAAAPLVDPDFWERVEQYFFSVYDNSLFDLALYTALISGIFAFRHHRANKTLRTARDSIPLVIGGWGTRGKSGTERLKAALINALGYGLVSKTTGCEAMFLYASEFGKTREMFLFRPYDKATIWEQRDVLRISENLGVQVFLWECMGLTPTYVEILQRQWTRDDISTITNTYPDHEDLQGPAGINIPQVMCNFIPEGSVLYTSEDQMVPILAEAAKKLHTRMHKVTWLESGLLTEDVLSRFPYEEHPNNIALVCGVASEIGVPEDFAVKEMADRVVADLGVLKTYPVADVRTRRLEFTNGMSANERHGCLGNWTRLGFDKNTLESDPDVWIGTVVNNRADRIARSRVFADILVRDLSADRHFLIGDNLAGLAGYIEEAWAAYAGDLTLKQEDENGVTEDPVAVFLRAVRRLRLPTTPDQVRAFLRAMLDGQEGKIDVDRLESLWGDSASLRSELETCRAGIPVEAILAQLDEKREALEEVASFRKKLESAGYGDSASLDLEFRELLSKWFHRKLVTVEDYYASGNEVVSTIAEAAPPGLRCRVLGLQNIKGTGLDFVYRWQAWDTCHLACELARSNDPSEIDEGIKSLAQIREFGILDERHVRDTLELVRESPLTQNAAIQAQVETVANNLDLALRTVHEQSGSSGSKSRWLEITCGYLEEFFDAGDAVRRRRAANRIYKDLVAERISQERAALELQKLIKRQKGGWFLRRVRSIEKALSKFSGLVLWKRRRPSGSPTARDFEKMRRSSRKRRLRRERK